MIFLSSAPQTLRTKSGFSMLQSPNEVDITTIIAMIM
jgi:hypothetical protein